MKSKCESCKKCECDDKQIRVSFCPSCKSRDVKYVFGLGNLFGVVPKQKCGKCGAIGPFPLLVTSKKLLVAWSVSCLPFSLAFSLSG